jgi:hypothetical protein
VRENGEYVNLANRTLRHRLIRNRENPEIEGGVLINTIGPGTNIDRSNGSRVNQNFIILPEYENESSMPTQVKFSARYEIPMMDINNKILFNGDTVMYNGIEYTIHTITYSKDGVPTRATLEKNGVILIRDEKEVDVLGEDLVKL